MTERTIYKGKPVLVLKRDENDKFPFSFGVAKAKLILENHNEIDSFVVDSETKSAD